MLYKQGHIDCHYRENLDTQKIAVIILKLEQDHFATDDWPKRCRQNSSLIWVYTVCPDLSKN